MNSLHTISPYKWHGQWVFDDPEKELSKEPFVAGIDDMLDRIAPLGQCTLVFSSESFPGVTHRLNKTYSEDKGNWYHSPELNLIGWLCPVLLKYFPSAPEQIFIQLKSTNGD